MAAAARMPARLIATALGRMAVHRPVGSGSLPCYGYSSGIALSCSTGDGLRRRAVAGRTDRWRRCGASGAQAKAAIRGGARMERGMAVLGTRPVAGRDAYACGRCAVVRVTAVVASAWPLLWQYRQTPHGWASSTGCSKPCAMNSSWAANRAAMATPTRSCNDCRDFVTSALGPAAAWCGCVWAIQALDTTVFCRANAMLMPALPAGMLAVSNG